MPTRNRTEASRNGAFDPRMWYRFRNAYKPKTHCLDVVNDAGDDSTGLLKMASVGYYAGQYWQLKPDDDGETYYLRTWWLGPNRYLDVYTDNRDTLVLQRAGGVLGQRWKVEPWGDGTWSLSNALSGEDEVLDMTEDGKVKMKWKDGSANQRWSIEILEEISQPEYLEN